MSAAPPPIPPVVHAVPVYPAPVVAPAPRRPVWVAWVIFILLAIILFVVLQGTGPTRYPTIPLSTFAKEIEAGNVSRVSVGQDTLRGAFQKPVQVGDGTSLKFSVEIGPGMGNTWGFVSWLLAIRNGADVEMVNDQSLASAILIPLIPWLLIFAFIWFFVFRHLRNQRAGQPPIPVYLTQPNVQSPSAPQPPPQL